MKISNKLVISPTDSCYKRAKEFCENELTIKNPKFTQAERMGFWTGNIPRYIRLYATDSDNLILPFGCYQYFLDDGRFETYFAKNPPNEMQGNIKLYDYQEVAVNQLVKAKNGILIAPTGAGKTILSIEELADAENPTVIKDNHRTPEEKAEIVELKHRICEAMKKLSQREQDLIEAKYFYDKKLKDISVEFNISQSRISRIIQNALDKVKKELLKQESLNNEDNI